MARPTPDLQGFADAQENLRTTFGEQVRFYGPAAMIYDPSLTSYEFDNEGIPLDPLAGASAVASANVALPNLTFVGSAQVNVVFKPLQTSILRRDQSVETELAIRSGLNKDLILRVEDYAQVSRASHFEVGRVGSDGTWTPEDGELFKIVGVKKDETTGAFERVIVYGEGTL